MTKKKYIQDYILLNINNGKWKATEKILSENGLAQKLSVSRLTVRHALQELVHKGILYSERGKGYMVSSDHDSQMIRSFSSDNNITSTKGEKLDGEHFVFKEILKIKNPDKCFLFKKHYYIEGKLIATQYTALNKDIIWKSDINNWVDSITKELTSQGISIKESIIDISFSNDKRLFDEIAKELGWSSDYPVSHIDSYTETGWIEKSIRVTHIKHFKIKTKSFRY